MDSMRASASSTENGEADHPVRPDLSSEPACNGRSPKRAGLGRLGAACPSPRRGYNPNSNQSFLHAEDSDHKEWGSMAEDRIGTPSGESQTYWAWTELFRTFQIALDPKKLILAAAGIVMMWIGWWPFQQLL